MIKYKSMSINETEILEKPYKSMKVKIAEGASILLSFISAVDGFIESIQKEFPISKGGKLVLKAVSKT